MRFFLLLFLPVLLFGELEKVSLQLEWKHQFEYAGFYAAIEKGFYKDAALEVEIKEFEYGIDITEDILSQKSTFGISSSSVLLEKMQNKPLVLMASYFKQNVLALAVKQDIKTPSELKNKKIMALPLEIKKTSLGVMLNENGLSMDDYELVEHDFKIDRFVSGEVDAMSIFTTNQTFQLDKLGIKYNILNPANFGIYSYDLELFTSKEFALKNRDSVKRFIIATNKGWEYAFENKEEIVELIYKKYSKSKSKEALLYEAEKTEKLFKTNIFKIGAVVPELVKLNMEIFKKLNLLNKDSKASDILSEFIFNNDENIKAEENPFLNNSKIDLTDEEIAFLNKKIVIKIANELDWPPFDYNELGKPKGLSIDYIKLLCDKTGLRYEFVNGYTWSELLSLFKEKKIDLIPAFYKDEERQKYTNFTSPYYHGELAIFSNKDYVSIKSGADLKNKKIGVQKDDGGVAIIKKHLSSSQIIEYSTNNELTELLSSKKLDAIVGNTIFFKHYIKENNLQNLHLIDYINMDKEEQNKISLHIGVRKDMEVLYTILQKTINSLSDKEIKIIQNRWLNYDIGAVLNLTHEETAYLKKAEIKMCVDPDWMPFEKLQDGKHIGMSADFFKIIEKNLGKTIEIVPTSSWSQSIEFAKSRKCDLFSLAMKTPKREEYMNFTTPYLNIPLVLATNTNVPFVADFNTLQNEKVGIPKGYAFAEILKNRYPSLKIVEVENIQEGLKRVKSGELFGYIGTLASVGYIFQTQFTGELKIAGKFDESWNLGIGVRNDDPALLSIMQKAVDSITETEKREILNKWVAIKWEKGIDYTLIWQITFVALLILFGTLYWNRKLRVLNKQLQIARIKADEATKEKSNFLANMSHEIRTPMNSILGMIYLIKETNLNKIQQDYFQKIETSSKNLLNLINDILDFSKLEARKMEIKNVDFNLLEVLNNAENMLKLKADEKGLEYKITYDKSMPMHLYGDSMRLSQILINLLSNAIKFTEKGYVELIVEKSGNSRFKFSVCDTGIGLTNRQSKEIFSSFTQADSSITRKYGGTGLGLSISKELIELMGGKLEVESVYGEGSRFVFELVIRASKHQKEAKGSQTAAKEEKLDENKPLLSDENAKELFEKLRDSTKTRRPKQCEPIISEIQRHRLSDKSQKIFENAKQLINRYKFDEAGKILDEK